MTTLTPSKFYLCTTGWLIAQEKTSLPFTFEKEPGFYVEFDPSSLPEGTTGNKFVIVPYNSGVAPQSVLAYNYFKLDAEVKVGNIVWPEYEYRYSSFRRGYQPYDVWDSNGRMAAIDGKIYVLVDNASYPNDSDPDHINLTALTFSFTEGTPNPFVVTSSFAGGYKNPERDFQIQLSPTQYTSSLKQYTVAGGTFYYSIKDAGNYSSFEFTGPTVTVPANTFTAGNEYDIYIVARNGNGDTVTCGTAVLTTVDGTAVVEPVSPNNTVMGGEITARWNYSNSTGEAQYAFDLQISTDDGDTWTDMKSHVVSSETTTTFTQTTAGDTLWRVRGYNQNDVAGSWSSTAFYVNNIPPEAPVILGVDAGGRITVKWTSASQTAFQVQIQNAADGSLVFDSGETYGSGNQYKVNQYLPDGNYVIRVKILNNYGKSSAYAEMSYTQQCQLADPDVTVAVQPESDSVLISVSNFDDYAKAYVMRNGLLIAKITGGTFTDLYASGPTTYTIIAVDSDDFFGMASAQVDVIHKSPVLITRGGVIRKINRRWNARLEMAIAESIGYEAQEYLGASTPEHFVSRMHRKRMTASFDDWKREASGMLGEKMYYADQFGNGEWVIPVSLSRNDRWYGNETVLELEMTTPEGGIQYEV